MLRGKLIGALFMILGLVGLIKYVRWVFRGIYGQESLYIWIIYFIIWLGYFILGIIIFIKNKYNKFLLGSVIILIVGYFIVWILELFIYGLDSYSRAGWEIFAGYLVMVLVFAVIGLFKKKEFKKNKVEQKP